MKRTEDTMKQTELEQYRLHLFEMRAAELRDVGELEETMHRLDADRREEIEDMDRAQNEVPEEVLGLLDDQQRQKLGEIQAALARIESGTFGVCEACGFEPRKGHRLAVAWRFQKTVDEVLVSIGPIVREDLRHFLRGHAGGR